MHCPTLAELPSPPASTTGWPWTEGSPQLPISMPDASPWPMVTIVTPSFNQGQFIEETIRSVLLQGYPSLEYLVMDGGSTDNSVEIIRKYEPWLKYWVSEKDSGQSDAINKGFARGTGSVLAWLNSDDRFQFGAIRAAVEFLRQHADVGMVYGDYTEIDEHSNLIGTYKSPDFDLCLQIVHQLIPQPTAFFQRVLWEQMGPLNVNFHYVMDYDLWTRAALRFPIVHIHALMADMRMHSASKTVGQTERFYHDWERFYEDFFVLPDLPPQIRDLESLARGTNFFMMGIQYLEIKQYQEARRAFEHAWHIYPPNSKKLKMSPFWLDTVLKTNIGISMHRLLAWAKRQK